jgi:hypothetical protein
MFLAHFASLYLTLFFSALASSASQLPASCPQLGPNPVPVSQIPSLFPPTKPSDLQDTESIRQTLAFYALAIDAKSFSSLDLVFAPDAIANYSAPLGVLAGLPAIQSVLQQSLAMFASTQHLLGTSIVNVCARDVAVSVTYFTATHWLPTNGTAQGDVQIVDDGGVIYGHAQYQDVWKRVEAGWRIVRRNLVYMVSFLFFSSSLGKRMGKVVHVCMRGVDVWCADDMIGTVD